MRPCKDMSSNLKSSYHNATLGLRSLRMRIDTIIIAQSNVNKTTLIGAHRRKAHSTMLAGCTRGSRVSHRYHFVVAPGLVPLDINSNRIAESKLPAHQKGEQRLQRLECTTMPSNEDSEIGGGDIKNEFTFITLILVNGGIGGIKECEQVAQYGYGDVGDRIKLFVGQVLISLVFTGDLRIRPTGLLDFRAEFFRHGNSIT